MKLIFILSVVFFICATVSGQRVTTIQLDGVQYYISRMNPYSPELNYFLAYQYCRSLGLQLVSFETKEKHDSITEYLSNAGYTNYDFWTSGNNLGTKMFLWMSTGIPFNATFDYFDHNVDELPVDNLNTAPQRTARDDGHNGQENKCVLLESPSFNWSSKDCSLVKDFICEQTRCYYYNYGSIPVTSAQGRSRVTTTTFSTTFSTTTPYPLKESEASSLYHTLASTVSPINTVDFDGAAEEDSNQENSIEAEEPTDASSTEDHYDEEEINATEEHVTNTESQDEVVDQTEESSNEERSHVDNVEDEEIPVEQKLKQISEEIEKYSNDQVEPTEDRQSFFSLSDLIKTLQPAVKKAPQIDSDYSNTMKVLGEQTSYINSKNPGVGLTNRSL